MELWDLYNKEGQLLNKTHERGKPLQKGEYHLCVQIYVMTSNKEILITQRHPRKDKGLCWEVTGGSVVKGEDSYTGAKRELFEETGLKANELKFLGRKIKRDYITDTYIYYYDFDLSEIKLQDIEVVGANKVNFETLKQMAEDGKFIESQFKTIIDYKIFE